MKKFLTLLLLLFVVSVTCADTIRIASKRFPESRLLAVIMATLIEAQTDLQVEQKLGMGGTLICFKALTSGEIDLYPEYTGTGWTAILKREEKVPNPQELLNRVRKIFLERYQLVWLEPFGFNNTYALAVKPGWDLEKISDLKGVKERIRAGFSHEFLERPDGYPGLSRHYGLGLPNIQGLDHGLAYKALGEGKIDLTDAYSTDGKIPKYDLVLLEDDKGFFPPYYATPLLRKEVLDKHPELAKVLNQLAGKLDDERMRQLNYKIEVERKSFSEVARNFLLAEKLIEPTFTPTSSVSLWKLTGQHLYLTLIATGMAISLGVPLGLLVCKFPFLSTPVLGACGVIQTIPSLAVLGFMIPLFGIGLVPAIAALFLYALLPIVRNTYTGIQEVSPELKEAARGMGMRPLQIMFLLELPLATRVIMAGIRTAMVINIGTATLAAFIGAGGLGEPILTGLSLNDNNLILWGAIPAAILALVVDFILARFEYWLEPRGLQLEREQQK